MITGWILENGDSLKKVVVKVSTLTTMGGGVDIHHEGDEGCGVSIVQDELNNLINLLTEIRDNPR